MGVTKTDFMRGMQCPKMLWLDKHKPEEKIIPQEVQARLDKGNEFGDSAMGMFGEYVEVSTYKPNGQWDYAQMIEKTKGCVSLGVNVICEASFSYYYNFCAVDILKKVENGYEMYEVKDSPEVVEQFVKDIGFQRWILEKCGINVVKCCIVYHGEDEENPFVIKDVTQDAKSYSYEVDDNIWRLGRIKKQDDEPNVPMGEQCNCPYECWYMKYCERNKNK